MEFVDGEDLASMLRRVGPLVPRRAAAIAAQVARGLAAAHQRGIIHRDVSSRNILIGREGRAQIADFGIAHAILEDGLLLEQRDLQCPQELRTMLRLRLPLVRPLQRHQISTGSALFSLNCLLVGDLRCAAQMMLSRHHARYDQISQWNLSQSPCNCSLLIQRSEHRAPHSLQMRSSRMWSKLGEHQFRRERLALRRVRRAHCWDARCACGRRGGTRRTRDASRSV